ncbi:MAG: (2Fe-2S)-binding protein [Phycisphaerales bacterium]
MTTGNDGGVSRRSFIKTMGVSAAGSAAASAVGAASREIEEDRRRSIDAVPSVGPKPINATLRVNGRDLKVECEPTDTLADTLRWTLDLTGTKVVCDRGACGACSVRLDGKLVASCMTLTVDALDAEIETIEGLAQGDELDPIQESFIRHDALQCGYCTPGLVMACRDLLDHNPKPDTAAIRQALAGNICRCGTYTNIFNAVLDASGQPVPNDRNGGEG